MVKYGKMQDGVMKILGVMLVVSLLLAIGAFAQLPTAHADPCAYFDCNEYWGWCECPGGYWGCGATIHECCYNPFPEACSHCPSPCCWSWCYCPECY
jgi:hypothetical protein